jgi:hypothetical protein
MTPVIDGPWTRRSRSIGGTGERSVSRIWATVTVTRCTSDESGTLSTIEIRLSRGAAKMDLSVGLQQCGWALRKFYRAARTSSLRMRTRYRLYTAPQHASARHVGLVSGLRISTEVVRRSRPCDERALQLDLGAKPRNCDWSAAGLPLPAAPCLACCVTVTDAAAVVRAESAACDGCRKLHHRRRSWRALHPSNVTLIEQPRHSPQIEHVLGLAACRTRQHDSLVSLEPSSDDIFLAVR